VRPDAFSRIWPDSIWTEIRPSVLCGGYACVRLQRRQNDAEVIVPHQCFGILSRFPGRLTVQLTRTYLTNADVAL
jgi:hypothetical protein